jgi:hypothetical protein
MGEIGIPGDFGRTYPTDQDSWTYDANWVADLGSYASNIVTVKVGANSMCMTEDIAAAPYEYLIRRALTGVYTYGNNQYRTLNFWIWAGLMTVEIRLYSPDSSNYFYIPMTYAGAGAWDWKSLQFGTNNEYDVDKNPNGWQSSGSPYWGEITAIAFYATNNDFSHLTYIDGLYFGHGRFRASVDDASSDRRDAEYIFNNLTSDDLCTKRAQTLLYQQKDAPVQITATLRSLNTNIRPGDRCPVTILPEGINSVDYDIISVEHLFNAKPSTTATMVNSGNIRNVASRTPVEAMINRLTQLRDLGRAERSIF